MSNYGVRPSSKHCIFYYPIFKTMKNPLHPHTCIQIGIYTMNTTCIHVQVCNENRSPCLIVRTVQESGRDLKRDNEKRQAKRKCLKSNILM